MKWKGWYYVWRVDYCGNGPRKHKKLEIREDCQITFSVWPAISAGQIKSQNLIVIKNSLRFLAFLMVVLRKTFEQQYLIKNQQKYFKRHMFIIKIFLFCTNNIDGHTYVHVTRASLNIFVNIRFTTKILFSNLQNGGKRFGIYGLLKKLLSKILHFTSTSRWHIFVIWRDT